MVKFLIIASFVVLNLLTKFYITKFIINLFLAIPLFIYDLLKMDFSVFKGYGFWVFCGLGGSGKTLSLVDYLILMKEKYPSVKILTNFYCEVADGKINSWRDLLDTTNIQIIEIDEKTYNKFNKYGTYKSEDLWLEIIDNELKYFVRKNCGVIFGFDEIQLTFESTKWEDAPSNLLDYISQQRKLHKQIVSTSQVFTRVDKKLREQTNNVIECRSYFLGRLITNKYYETQEYISNGEKLNAGNRKRKCKKRQVFVGYDKIRQKYNTEEIMKELSTSKSNGSKLLDLISNYKKDKEE